MLFVTVVTFIDIFFDIMTKTMVARPDDGVPDTLVARGIVIERNIRCLEECQL